MHLVVLMLGLGHLNLQGRPGLGCLRLHLLLLLLRLLRLLLMCWLSTGALLLLSLPAIRINFGVPSLRGFVSLDSLRFLVLDGINSCDSELHLREFVQTIRL